jgi:hypothetical protein
LQVPEQIDPPVQTPCWQVSPVAHAWPHVPQLALSVCVFVHAPPQHVVPPVHWWPQLPQLLLSVCSSMHTPSQQTSPATAWRLWPARLFGRPPFRAVVD